MSQGRRHFTDEFKGNDRRPGLPPLRFARDCLLQRGVLQTFGSCNRPIYADKMAERFRVSTVRLALTEIADALSDLPLPVP